MQGVCTGACRRQKRDGAKSPVFFMDDPYASVGTLLFHTPAEADGNCSLCIVRWTAANIARRVSSVERLAFGSPDERTTGGRRGESNDERCFVRSTSSRLVDEQSSGVLGILGRTI